MHIPDGYLSPATCAVGFAIAVPAIAVGCRIVGRTVKQRHIPLLAMLSAVCFLIMMFNVPIPDGTTAHAVGGALVAVLLGPWAGLVAVAVALAFQAVLFGDGGVLAYGVNVLNLGLILPFSAFAIYRLISGRAPLTAPRRIVAAGIGGYLGLSLSALACGIELGIQPLLFHAADGAPLYSPYNLSQTIPAMLLAHLTVAGVVEGLVTAGVLAYLRRANLPLLRLNHPRVPDRAEQNPQATATVPTRRRLRPGVVAGTAMAVLLLLTPLGLLAPGTAFGEGAPENLDLSDLGLSAVPVGLARYTAFWRRALLGNYGFADGEHPVAGYLLSALVGVAAIGLFVFLVALAVAAIRRSATRRSGSAGGDVPATEPATSGDVPATWPATGGDVPLGADAIESPPAEQRGAAWAHGDLATGPSTGSTR